MPKSFEKPVGYIKLNSRPRYHPTPKPIFINMEKICCFGVRSTEHGSWIALSGRQSLVYVEELPSEITAAIEAARNEYRI